MNTDGKNTFLFLNKEIKLKSEKINYGKKEHRLRWLNAIIGDIKNNVTGIYHGITKESIPLFLHEQEWQFNHRYTRVHVMDKVVKYITQSFPIDSTKLAQLLDI